MADFYKNQVLKLLESADVIPGGGRPWDIEVHDEHLYRRSILGGTLGFGEAYMHGWFYAPAID
jgi:cyclopropane-fatty-acyl-phospholipid synthase